VLSWIISPITGAIMAFFIFRIIRGKILLAADSIRAVIRVTPIFAGITVFMIVLAILYKGLANLKLQHTPLESLIFALLLGALSGLIFYLVIRRQESSKYRDLENIERVFMVLQTITAAYIAFAHGANDVANAIGPLAAVFAIVSDGVVAFEIAVPMWILILGGVGIVIGLATWGYKVIRTVGSSITELTPSRGFAATFSAASVVLVCSKLGLPVSTTHTLVGAVVGVGMAQGISSINLKVMRSIVVSWLLTLPIAGGLTIAIYWGLKTLYTNI
jgi:PiT family inorganic phosphate transporter